MLEICGYLSNFTSGIEARHQFIVKLADKMGKVMLRMLKIIPFYGDSKNRCRGIGNRHNFYWLLAPVFQRVQSRLSLILSAGGILGVCLKEGLLFLQYKHSSGWSLRWFFVKCNTGS